jgi:hypothetical protein
LGERLNGIQEVGGSIPPGSTNQKHNKINNLSDFNLLFWFGKTNASVDITILLHLRGLDT